ncbi:hypothetical protein Tco_0615583 [Tanacetum coccineum]
MIHQLALRVKPICLLDLSLLDSNGGDVYYFQADRILVMTKKSGKKTINRAIGSGFQRRDTQDQNPRTTKKDSDHHTTSRSSGGTSIQRIHSFKYDVSSLLLINTVYGIQTQYDVSTLIGYGVSAVGTVNSTCTIGEQTIEEYMAQIHDNIGPGIVMPYFGDAVCLELKVYFLKELYDNTFSRTENKDDNEHIAKVLDIVDLFYEPDVNEHQLMLCVFPMTLTGQTFRWIKTLPTGSITTWSSLKTQFLHKFSRAYHQMNAENAAIQDLTYHSQMWHEGASNRRRVGGRYRANASGYYVKEENKMGYQEKRSSFEETLNKFMEESAKREKETTKLIKEIVRERVPGTLPSSTKTNPQDQAKHVSHDDVELKEDAPIPKVMVARYQPPIPSTSWLVERKSVDQDTDVLTSLKKLKVNIPRVEALKGMPGYYRHLEDLLKNKSRIDDKEKAKMNEWCFAWLENTLPSKEKDLDSFTLPCLICSFSFSDALTDLRATVSFMPYTIFTCLGLGELVPTKLKVEMANKSIKLTLGIVEYSCLLHIAKIDVFEKKISLRAGKDKIVFKDDKLVTNTREHVYSLKTFDALGNGNLQDLRREHCWKIFVEYEWKPPRCSTYLIFDHSPVDCLKTAPKQVVYSMDKGKGQSSGADDEGFIEVKKKKSDGINGGNKTFKPVSVKPKTRYRPVAKQLTGGTSNSPKTTSKMSASTSGNDTFSFSNSFEALNVVDSDFEEVGSCNKASTFGVQEEGKRFTPIIEKINNFEKQLLEGKRVLVDEDGNPLEKADYSGDEGSEDEVACVDNEMESHLASNPSRVGYGTKSLLEQLSETYGNVDADYDPYDDDMYESQNIPDNIQSICDNLDIKVRGRKKK